MAKHLWTVICSRAIVDSETKQATLVDIVEKVTVHADIQAADSETPVFDIEAMLETYDMVKVPVRLSLVCLWTRSVRDLPEASQSRFRIKTGTGKTVAEAHEEIPLGQTVNARMTINFDSFPFAGYGVYSVETWSRSEGKRWKKHTVLPLEVWPTENPQGTQQRPG